MTQNSKNLTNKIHSKIAARFCIEQFKKHRQYSGLIKRMETQGASAIQIKEAIEKELGYYKKLEQQ